MENQPEQNQQSVSGGQAMQVNNPQAPVAQTQSGDIHIYPPALPQPEPPVSETPQNLPYSGVVAFVGREMELDRLHEGLQREQSVSISAIAGMGGIGKTELALQYARKHCREGSYPGGLCWIRAREEVGTQILSFVRSLLNLTPPEDLELVEKVRWCWGRWREGAVLLVFDDVQKYEDVESFLPPQDSRFKILMTTRSHFGFPVQELPLDVLSEEKALELLRSLVQDERVDQQLGRAKELCEWLGYLPLGVELVGRYLAKKKDVSIELLWQRLQEKRLEARAFKQAEPGMTASLGVAAAFELSWQSLDESAQQVAALLSLFALVEIPWKLVEQCLPEVDAEELEDIRDQGLLGANLLKRVDQGMYQLHQLLREFFASKREQRSDMEELKRKFYEVVIAEAERVKDKPERSLIHESTVMIAHLQAAIELVARPEQVLDLATCLNWIAELCHVQGRYVEAERLYLQVLSIQEQQLGNSQPAVAKSLNNLAALYDEQGQYAEAEPLYLRSLEIRKLNLGDDHLDVAVSLNDLAVMYDCQGRYAEAEPLYLRSLEIRQEKLGDNHSDVAVGLNNLASLYYHQGRYEEAESLMLKALDIRQRLLTNDHPDLAFSLSNLAALYASQGRCEEAEPLMLRSLDISQKHLGDNHPVVAGNLYVLAFSYYSQGRYEEAEPLMLRSLEIYQRQFGSNHPQLAASLNNLAALYDSQGRYEDAEPLHLQSLEIQKRQLGDNHPDVAVTLNNLARAYRSQERWSDAELLFLQSLSILQNQLPHEHPLTARISSNLAYLYDLQGRLHEAEAFYLQSLPILFANLEENHYWRQEATNNFRSLLQKAIQENRTDELSDDPMTRSMLQKLQFPSD